MNIMSWRPKVCSTCLGKSNLYDISKNDVDNISYIDKLKMCFDVDMINEENSFLCEDCIIKLNVTFDFLQIFKESQATLKKQAKELKSPQNKTILKQEELYDDFIDLKTELHEDKIEDLNVELNEVKTDLHKKKSVDFSCKACNKVFKRRQYLIQHLKTHSGEKCYKCTYCDKKFYQISTQKRHIKSHEQPPGSKAVRTPYLCTICGKSFPYSNTRNRHMHTHLGIKTHECKVCQRKFTQSTHLNVHMRTHTGERPYICEICGKAFSLNSGLQKHRKHHETNANSKIDIVAISESY